MTSHRAALIAVLLAFVGATQVFAADNVIPGKVQNVTSSHDDAKGDWNDPQSRDNTVEVTWDPAVDNEGGSGLDGYSFEWSTADDTIPDMVKDLEENVQSRTSPVLADGNSHYFHIRAVDNAGNWGLTEHIGPFYIDTVAPEDITDLSSVSHGLAIGGWDPVQSHKQTVWVNWLQASDTQGGSGVDGYLIIWDRASGTEPTAANSQRLSATANQHESGDMTGHDGTDHYFHIRAVDKAGNLGDFTQIGPFYVDLTPPVVALQSALPGDINDGVVSLILAVNDLTSGIDHAQHPQVTYTPTGGVAQAAVETVYANLQWRGTADIDVADPVGAVTVSVTQNTVTDLAGNGCLLTAFPGAFNVLRPGGWPLAAQGSRHQLWHAYGEFNESGGFDHFHEGVDMPAPGGTDVLVIETGRVARVNTPAVAYHNWILVARGLVDPAGPGPLADTAFNYMHITIGNKPMLNPPVTPAPRQWRWNDEARPGDTMGTVIAIGGVEPHLHFEYNHRQALGWGSGRHPDYQGDPLPLLEPCDDATDPEVNHVFIYRRGEHEVVPAGGASFCAGVNADGHIIIHQNVDLIARAHDEFETFGRDLGIQKISFRVRNTAETAVIPWRLLEHFDGPFVATPATLNDMQDADLVHVLYETIPGVAGSTAGAVGVANDNDARYFYILTNVDDDNDLEVTDAASFWDTNTRIGEEWWDTHTAAAPEFNWTVDDARYNGEAKFSDGRYEVAVRAEDEQGNRDEHANNVVIDNFGPLLQKVIVKQEDRDSGIVRTVYEAEWRFDAATDAYDLHPATAAQRNPHWISAYHDVEFELSFSEPMDQAVDPPTLRFWDDDAQVVEVDLVVVPGSEAKIWKGTLAADDLRAFALDSEDGRILRVEGRDLAGNQLDMDPVSISRRRPDGTWEGDDLGVDTNHRIKIDTVHEDKPEPLLTSDP